MHQYEYSTKRVSNGLLFSDKYQKGIFSLIDTKFNPRLYYESGRAFIFTNVTLKAAIWFKLTWQDPWELPEIKKYYSSSIKLFDDFHGAAKLGGYETCNF